MKKLLPIDFQAAAYARECRAEANIAEFNRMKDRLFEGDYKGTREDYVTKMRDLFKSILRDIRSLATLYAKYYSQFDNSARPFIDGQIELYSRRFNRFIDRYNRSSNWRVIKGLQLPQRFTFGD